MKTAKDGPNHLAERKKKSPSESNGEMEVKAPALDMVVAARLQDLRA